MKMLIIVRHGKSSWEFPSHDYERPLTPKGISNSIKIATHFNNLINSKTLIWSSFANRALSTAKIMVNEWNITIDAIVVKKELYTFDERQLTKIIQSCPDDCDSLLVFGHNNAITDFVNKFGDIFIDNVPTSGLVSIIFETNSWSTFRSGKTNKILFPSDI
jgi:phosphohistidine phosphatase